MALTLRCENISKSFGSGPLFRNVTLSVEQGDRIGLIGPNGSGKSTLLKILAGAEQPDEGTVTRARGLRAGYVTQTDVFPPESRPVEVLVAAMEAAGTGGHDPHEREVAAAVLLDKVGFEDFEQRVDSLSGGWRKRLAIARALAAEPDLLLLDEPTNHLDLEGILWLEDLLEDAACDVVVVTHDRYFLEAVTTRIVELSRAYPEGTIQVAGPYSEFLQRREAFLEAQQAQQVALASKVRQDVAWLQRGAKARRTKAKGRIADAAERAAELADLKRRNARTEAAGIAFSATGRQTRNLLVGKGVSKTLGEKQLFADLDLTLAPGSCLGLLGPNGSGKTTLIRVLTGELPPDRGSVKRADDLRIVTLSQRRAELDRRQELRTALCPVGDVVEYRGRSIHVTSWAKRFLFRPEQFNVAVGDLSGGEQARIIIARLVCQPADLLVLDEPTNDLDIPTLEILEESLAEFPGGVLLVTHDRFMLERLATEVVGLDGKGGVRVFASYSQWEAAQAATAERGLDAGGTANSRARDSASGAAPAAASKVKLSYKEQREWDAMEARIEAAESRVAELNAKMNDPELLADHERLGRQCELLNSAQTEVAALYERWAELEAKQA